MRGLWPKYNESKIGGQTDVHDKKRNGWSPSVVNDDLVQIVYKRFVKDWFTILEFSCEFPQI
jgi:hypothetical protein